MKGHSPCFLMSINKELSLPAGKRNEGSKQNMGNTKSVGTHVTHREMFIFNMWLTFGLLFIFFIAFAAEMSRRWCLLTFHPYIVSFFYIYVSKATQHDQQNHKSCRSQEDEYFGEVKNVCFSDISNSKTKQGNHIILGLKVNIIIHMRSHIWFEIFYTKHHFHWHVRTTGTRSGNIVIVDKESFALCGSYLSDSRHAAALVAGPLQNISIWLTHVGNQCIGST